MYSNLFVCLFGMGTVFFGLICLILLTNLTSAVCRKVEGSKNKAAVPAPASAAVPAANPAKQQELEVAAAAAIGEELGVKADRIRIVSMRKL